MGNESDEGCVMIDGRAMVSNPLKKGTQHARAYRQRHGRGERRGEKQNDFGITASRLSSDFNARISTNDHVCTALRTKASRIVAAFNCTARFYRECTLCSNCASKARLYERRAEESRAAEERRAE